MTKMSLVLLFAFLLKILFRPGLLEIQFFVKVEKGQIVKVSERKFLFKIVNIIHVNLTRKADFN